MPTATTLEMSTGHLPDTERDLLGHTLENDPDFPIRVVAHQHGWLLPVPTGGDDLDEAFRELLQTAAPALALLLAYAAGTGARFIYLDADADTHPGLPWHDDDTIDLPSTTYDTVGSDLLGREGQQLEVDPGVWRQILHAAVDPLGTNGGDPGDIVVSVEGDSRAYAPNQKVRWRPGPHN